MSPLRPFHPSLPLLQPTCFDGSPAFTKAHPRGELHASRILSPDERRRSCRHHFHFHCLSLAECTEKGRDNISSCERTVAQQVATHFRLANRPGVGSSFGTNLGQKSNRASGGINPLTISEAAPRREISPLGHPEPYAFKPPVWPRTAAT